MPDDHDPLNGKLLESLPDGVTASLEVRDAWRRQMAASSAGLEFLVSDVLRWVPGSTVRVAFLDGDDELHADVAEAIRQITDSCNLMLDFGVDGSGRHRRWTEQDVEHQAEIRVSFDLGGYWSLVGTGQHGRDRWPAIRACRREARPAKPEPRWIQGRPPRRLAGDRASRVPARAGLQACPPEPARSVRSRVSVGRRPGIHPYAGRSRRLRPGRCRTPPGDLHLSRRPAEPLATREGRSQPTN